jgi:putative addiction module antidote
MVCELKLRQVGGSIAATLPQDMADRLHLAAGDRLLAIETDQRILLTPFDPTVREALEALEVAANVSGTCRNALRQLAQ